MKKVEKQHEKKRVKKKTTNMLQFHSNNHLLSSPSPNSTLIKILKSKKGNQMENTQKKNPFQSSIFHYKSLTFW